jgi:GT2 family glycosyltransferase
MWTGYPKVAIVILNWNGLADTLECLKSLQKIVYPNYAIVVIDNGSKGNDAEIIRKEFGAFVSVVEEEKNIGFVGGCNVGIRWALHSGAKHVLLLNNDTVVDPNFLTELVRVAQNDTQIGIVGPKVYYYEQPKRIFTAGGKVNFWTGNTALIRKNETIDGRFDKIEEVDFVSGCALLIKAETIRRIGLLNEQYFAYYEETEWCLNAKKEGFKVVYVPKAEIWHKSHKTRTSGVMIYYMTRNRFLFVKRNSNVLQFVVFNLYFLATDLLGQIKTGLFMKPELLIAYLRGIRDGLGIYANVGRASSLRF